VEVLETNNVALRKVSFRWGVNIPFPPEHALEYQVLTRLRRRNRLIRQAIEQLEPRSVFFSCAREDEQLPLPLSPLRAKWQCERPVRPSPAR
jgi:hypothetical protein